MYWILSYQRYGEGMYREKKIYSGKILEVELYPVYKSGREIPRRAKKENIIRVINDEKIILETQNPLEAWTIYIQILDCKIRKELESWCIKHNRDPTTGE